MFRDTSMDYLSRDEVLEIWNNNMRLTDEQLLAMDETEFRARVRERSHHTLEIQVYATAYRHQKLKPNQADYTKHLLELWEKRGLGKDLPEYRYASFLIDAAEKLVKGEDVDLTPYKPTPVTEQMEKDFFTIVKERRSVREFKDKEVPDELIDKILEAGLWAAHGCNVQSIRYVVVREKNETGLFRGSDVPGGPVHLVITGYEMLQSQLLYPGEKPAVGCRSRRTEYRSGSPRRRTGRCLADFPRRRIL